MQDNVVTKKRNLFEYKRVLDARDAYVAELNGLSGETLARHHQYLEAEMTRLDHEYHELRTSNKREPSGVKLGQMRQLSHEMSIMQRAANDIDTMPDLILQELRGEAGKVVAAFNDPERAMETPDGKFAAQYVKRIYTQSRPDTKERYSELDTWYALGSEFAINLEDKDDRAYKLALIPKPTSEAKWRFMIALADATYDINFQHSHPERLDDNNLKLLSKLYARLSQHERGADNPHMPYTHKLRHNPAIHSLHVVALADKIFHAAEKEINGHSTPSINRKWRKMRDKVMLAALVHDCGEMDGELSQGIVQASMTKEQAARFEEERNHAEAAVFERHLEAGRANLHHLEDGKPTDKPITDTEWAMIKKDYIAAFDAAEETQNFTGRFIKTIERMQSQHDYLRYNGISGATLLQDSEEDNRTFSMSYVSKIYRDATYDKAPGEQALASLVNKDPDPDMQVIYRAIAKAIEPEYQHLVRKNSEAYGVHIGHLNAHIGHLNTVDPIRSSRVAPEHFVPGSNQPGHQVG